MNPNYPQGGVTPNENATYPLARLNGSAYAAPLNFNNPSEVLSGYDAKVNPMTGEEIPDANFARGGRVGSDAGIARLLESRGRRGDTMLVHMAPEEVRGLQALALAHGGSLTINPQTGLYEASFLKKLLPTIAGAALNTFFPTAGKAVGSLFGLKDAAAANVGTGLIVGGITGLVEGDLQKGLAAGLGAYSGANIASSLRAADQAVNSVVSTPVPPSGITGNALKDVTSGASLSSMMEPTKSVLTGQPTVSSLGGGISGAIGRAPVPIAPAPAPVSIKPTKPTLMGGINALFKPEGREAFGAALGGGFESPFAQNLSKFATLYGVSEAFTPEMKQMPGAGGGDNIVYIPGERNPRYGTGKDEPYQLPGQYYKRTAQGLVPYNPFAKGFAEGGVVDEYMGALPFYGDAAIVGGSPGFVPAFSAAPAVTETAAPMQAGFQPINIPAFAAPTDDQNVLATRAYIEELNRQVRTPFGPQDTVGGRSIADFGVIPPAGGGGDMGGDMGGAAQPGIGDALGGLAASYLANKAITSGLGALKDKFFPGEDQLQEVEVTGTRKPIDATGAPALDPDLSALTQVGGDLSKLSSYMPVTQGLQSLGTLGGLNSTGLGALQPTTLADAAQMTNLSGAYAPSGSVASQFGGIRGALDASAGAGMPTPAGIKSLPDVPGVSIGQPVYDASSNLTGFQYPDGSFESLASTLRADPTAGSAAARAVIDRALATPLDLSGVVDPASLVNSPYAQLDPSLYQAPSTVTADLSGKGLGSLKGKIIPGVATALGAYQTAKAIEAGKEGRAAFSAAATMPAAAKLMNIGAIGGPAGMLAAAAIAAIGASLVKTDEMGAVSLRNYWRGIDEGRGIGQSNPQELAQGFINFYRTGKNNFPGLAKYGKKGNEDFVYDMTQVINNAVKSGAVPKDVDAPTMFREVVQPWLNTMGEGPSHPDARRVQDFMMTDLIHNFMQGAPISNAQVKGDKKFKIVSDRPVYAGIPPTLDRTIGGNAVPNDLAREMYAQNNVRQEDLDSWAMSNPIARMQALGQMPAPQSPFAVPEERATIMPVGESEAITPMLAPQSPFAVPEERATIMPVGESVPITPFDMGMLPQAPSEREMLGGEQPVYIPRDEGVGITPMPPAQFGPVEEYLGTPYMPEIPNAPEMGYNPFRFNMGGAVGEDYNFGFAEGGIPGEYKAGGRLLNGPGDGMSDDIPAVIRGKSVQRAALADGEFVVPADVVSHLGNGSTNAGAKKLYQMMSRVRQARTGKSKQAPAVKTARLLPA